MKKFNDTGLCIPKKNYMVDLCEKIKNIEILINEGDYFTINRPRQYGKTTMMSQLRRNLDKDEYLVISISLESIDSETYNEKEEFVETILGKVLKELRLLKEDVLIDIIEKNLKHTNNFYELGEVITQITSADSRKVVFLIDEVDKASNNQLFLDFLGMLRDKYLLRNDERDFTFQSVVLAGVHDVKNLKAKIRPDEERKYNSPWNIAADFNVDMSFSEEEIKTMLDEYMDEKKVEMDKEKISNLLYFYTSGYPYLVSKLCKIIDEQIMPEKYGENINWKWTKDDIIGAVKKILREKIPILIV